MNKIVACRFRAVACGVALVLAIVSCAAPVMAESAPRPLSAAAVAHVAALDARALEQASSASASGDRSFFSSKRGAIVGVLLAGVVAWAVVSRSKDAIHSPGRK